MLTVGLLAVLGIVAMPAAASAAPNPAIVVDDVVIGGGTGQDGQLVVGDTISISGTWDASDADPQSGDTFTIGLPPELKIPADIPFNLDGPNGNGDVVTFATCLADASTGVVTCTLTDAVATDPEFVKGEFSFDVEAVEATTEEELAFDLNGQDVMVELPGTGGIDDGIDLPGEVTKSGEMNANNWSMTWTVDIPGANLVAAGGDVAHITDTFGAGHVLCDPIGLKVQTVRGSTVVDVTDLATLSGEPGDSSFQLDLNAPQGGFDANVTYRVTYQTCTSDGQIDPSGTSYDNSMQIEGWGEAGHGVGHVTNRPWQIDLTKSGSVLGGADRNGKIAWTVVVPGDQLVGKDGFTFSEALGAGHELCTDTISGIRITERYGPSNQMQRDVTGMLTPTVVSQSAQGFEIRYDVNNPALQFKASDYRYVITYNTCVTSTDLPAGGTGYSNEANVDGKVTGNEAKVPGRTDQKNGALNSSTVTIDGVEHLPQTTLNWSIVVPGERLADIQSALTITDTLSGAHQVCTAGDPTGGLAAQLGLKVEARDQIQNGGLATVDLTGGTTVAQDGQELTFTIAQPTLPQPGGGTETGFSREYQYVISYTTCTTSGGMDAPGTSYGNTAVVAGKTYEKSVTQNNKGSGSGQGMPRGTVAIDKVLADTSGAAFVPDDAMFTVQIKEIDPNKVVQNEYDLRVPLNGAPVSGLNARGTGWTVEITEPTLPTYPGVVFGTPKFASGPGVTVSEDGRTAVASVSPNTNVSVSLTNTAQLGSVNVVKSVTGGAAALVDPDRTYQVTAHIDTSALGAGFPAQPDRTFLLTAGQPYALGDLPIGAVVTFSEAVPADDDQLTWGAPVFNPASITVQPANATTPAAEALTNSVERTVGTFSLVKNVTGDQAENPAVPDTVTVTATWTEEGGEPQQKVLTLPTDGTPVAFGENLLIGTEVTLTETPLADGSSIDWGAPTWSGTGVVVDGESAVVTIGRDAQAQVAVENHAATSTAGISLLKGVAGEAAGEVAEGTEFPVTATWTDDEGDHSVELNINATSPTPLGVDLPAGTVVTITEGERPGIDTVIWGSITISGTAVTDNGDGSATVVVSDQQDDSTLITVVNEATWAPGTFSLSKDVTGVLLENPDVPDAVTVTASWFEGDEQVSTEVRIATDGTVTSFGRDLPHGTEVTLSEAAPGSSAAFTWDTPAWAAEGIVANEDGTATITIGAATDLAVTLTNNATASLGSLTLLKTLSGDGATDVPDGTVFPVTATWTDLLGQEQRAELQLTPGEPAMLDELPLGTEVTLTEDRVGGLPVNLQWLKATWSTEDENVTVSADGATAVVTVTAEPGARASLSLDNEFHRIPDLATTGGYVSGGLIVLVVSLIGGGLLLMSRRRSKQV
ncbi:DUF5979 domain-containing protein [Microbacterium sp. NPDC057650]|uniref:DUF5979 domain-containing protein n=1 Tax=unclassified Microbacterium TaxID=2609290 RepID=UPI00366C0D20